MSTADEIDRLIKLRDAGTITPAQFEAMRNEAMSGNPDSWRANPTIRASPTSAASLSGGPNRSRTYVALGGVVIVLVVILLVGSFFTLHKNTPTSTSVPRGPTNLAAISSCNADARVLETAVSTYNAQNATPISVETGITFGTPSTYAHGAMATRLLSKGYLNAWPSYGNGYALSLSTTSPGDVLVFVPAASATPQSYNSETSSTGCYAL